MRSRRVLCVAAVLLLWAAGPALAQVTGSISGVVFDQNAAPVAGALVKISGDALPGGRTATTSSSGQYAFTLLQPGVYTVEVSKTGVGDSKRQAVVEVDKTSTLDIVLGLAVKEEILVTATQPVVDLKSTEVDTNYKRSTMEALPLERSYSGLFQLIPGVADNRSFAPAAGGTRQDNTYLLDGVNITNPSYGYLSSEVNELDIQEVNIKRAGVSAEFGRTSGVVTNAVSRSGTNSLSGTGRIDWLANSLIGNFTSTAFRDTGVVPSVSPAVGVGGPIVKDKLFWYGSARYFRNVIGSGRSNFLGQSLPDTVNSGHELYGKITAALTTRQMFNVGVRDRPNKSDNSGLGSGTSATVGTNDDNGSRIATASWAYFPANRTTVEVKYLYMKEKNVSTPLTNLGYLPTWNPNDVAAMGYYTDQAQQNLVVGGAQYTNADNYRRHEARGTLTQFFDLGKSTHELKAGLGYEFGEENLSRLSNGWGILSRITVSGLPLIRARYYFTQPPQLGQGRTWSAFVQDNITIASRLTVDAGLLLDRDEFAQNLAGSGGCPAVTLQGGVAPYASSGDRCTFLRFGFAKEIQPRIGANLVLDKELGNKVYANYGRYYSMDQKSSATSLAPRRIYQREARFDLLGNLISDVPRASTTGKMIDPNLKPTYNDEFLLGYASPLGSKKLWSFDAFFMYRKTHNFIEDVPSVLPDTGPYAAANLPCDLFASCIGAVAKRSYKAFTVELSRQLADRWNANVSYTWSRFEGNFDLDYSSGAVFNTSSFIQDGPGTFVQEPNRFGPLHQDRPHVFKIFSTWLPVDNLTMGGYFRVQSGTPWNAHAPDWEGASLNYLEPAGSHRNPTWANLDLLASYRVPMRGRSNVIFEARLLNVLGNQTRTSTDGEQYLDLNTIDNPPYFAPYTEPNPLFGTADGYAPPRRLFLDAKVNF